MGFKKNGTVDDYAHAVAKFKRKIDKIYNTGSIDKALIKFDLKAPKNAAKDTKEFSSKVRYYYKNKHAKPLKKNTHKFNAYVNMRCPLDEKVDRGTSGWSTKKCIGFVSMFSGTLLAIIPFAPCQYVGGAMFAYGLACWGDECIDYCEKDDAAIRRRREEEAALAS